MSTITIHEFEVVLGTEVAESDHEWVTMCLNTAEAFANRFPHIRRPWDADAEMGILLLTKELFHGSRSQSADGDFVGGMLTPSITHLLRIGRHLPISEGLA